jgi:hypothetical protein
MPSIQKKVRDFEAIMGHHHQSSPEIFTSDMQQ